MRDMGISHTWMPGYTMELAAGDLKLKPEFQLSSEITFLTLNLLLPKHTLTGLIWPNT